MLFEDLSILHQINSNEEDLISKYSKSNDNIISKSVLDEAQIPIYKKESSVLDQVHNALSNPNAINNLNPNALFNIKASHLGSIGVLERLSGLVANREDMDLHSISLAETYKDKSLDTKVMGGLYNFTLTDIYKDKNRWLQVNGAFTFGGLIKGNINSEIESDYHEYSGPIKSSESVYETKTAKSILSSKGLLSSKKNQTNINGSNYGHNDYDENSIEGASIYTELKNTNKKQKEQPKISMQELIDKRKAQLSGNSGNQINIKNNKEIKDLLSFPIYSESKIYNSDSKTSTESFLSKKISMAKRYKQIHSLNLNLSAEEEKLKKIKKKKESSFLYGLDIDTLNQTKEAHQKTFAPDNTIHIKKEKIDSHGIEESVLNNEKIVNLTKVSDFKSSVKEELKFIEEIKTNESNNDKKDELYKIKIEASQQKEIPKLKLEENKKLINLEKIDEKIEDSTNFKEINNLINLNSGEQKEIPKLKLNFEEPLINIEIKKENKTNKKELYEIKDIFK